MSRPRVSLITSNGWGLGHLSRQLAVALALADRADVSIFSFSRALAVIEQFGIRGEYCPGHQSPWIPRERWNKYVQARFETYCAEVDPDVVVFDGVAPYIGILNALQHMPGVSAGWQRRGMWLPGREEQLAKSSAFDFVIEPGDLAGDVDNGPTSELEALRVPPIGLLEVVPTLDRDSAREALGMDPERPALLFALRSGQPGEAADAGRVALQAASERTGWQIGSVSSPLAVATRSTAEADVVPINGVYPLARYVKAFDAAVSAAGYNAVHELLPAGVPTLLVPKSSSQTDDQLSRAAYLAHKGLALAARDDDLDDVRKSTHRLLNGEGPQIKANLESFLTAKSLGGARAVADILASGPPTGKREARAVEWRQPGWKGYLKRAIGPKGVALVQQILGRVPAQQPHHRRFEFTLATGQSEDKDALILDESFDVVARSADQPVEHLLAGSSAAYRQSREELIDRFYLVRR